MLTMSSKTSINSAPFQPRRDLPAGLVVFLVALPLCLGIALASNAPLFSGVIAGIVGGIVVGFASGSSISVSGPAAGLAVIVAASIDKLGGFPFFLATVVIAGLLQVAFGFLRFGALANYVPNSVIKGMLAAIGLVIILKQIPHALGRDDDFEGDIAFLEKAGNNTLTDIVKAFYSCNAEAILISVLSIAILVLWDQKFIKQNRLLQHIPGALVVVLLGIALNETFRALFPNFYLRAEDGHLVALPIANGLGAWLQQFTFPDWSKLFTPLTWQVAGTIALVASLESLLSLEAADKLDPKKRISPPNRELLAQGLGNIVSGLLGGLPVTSVVVRTSANVYANAQSSLSAIFHGLLLFLAVAAIPFLLNKIPLASLAAILIMVGYKLAKVDLFRSMYRSGVDQFLPFILTVIGIIFTDLLAGVAMGLAVGLFFVLRANHHSAITLVNEEANFLMRFNKDMTFVNKTELKETLASIPSNSTLLIDGSRALFIDKDIFDEIYDFQANARHRNIEVQLRQLAGKDQLLRGKRTKKEAPHGIA